MHLDEIVPWGRSYEEYLAMFALTGSDLGQRILGVGDGPAAFNAGAYARGYDVTSVDPIYVFTAEQIAARIQAVRPQIEAGVRAMADRCVWERYPDVETLIARRLAAMADFLTDYPGPHTSPRYCAARLPRLPYADGAFDLTLVSHLLFLYSDHLGGTGHREAVAELMRVSRETRIFPLVTLDGERSLHVESVMAQARAAGWQADIERVEYRFQIDGDWMLRLWQPPR
jgi:SAM-dependent methyltransferase